MEDNEPPGNQAQTKPMSSPLPLRPSINHTPSTRSVIDLTADTTEAVFGALGSETARSIIAALENGPATASDIADRVGTSLQNVQYHLNNLQEADLVADVGTWYSAKGKEMSVYAVTVDCLEFRLAESPDDQGAASEAGASLPTPAATLND